MNEQETTDETNDDATSAERTPGLLVVHSQGTPQLISVPLVLGRALIGRRLPDGADLPDERVSREHVEVSHSASGFSVRDLGSKNGTYVDGARVRGTITTSAGRVVRVGGTLLLLCDDLTPFRGATMHVHDNAMVGPRLAQVLSMVERAARLHQSVLLIGETGSGKEVAARHFHGSGPSAAGPFVAVNCAAIPAGVAERLLFGARRGAFSGATESTGGYLQAADGGVLFFDEFGELPLEVQAKLLRVLETREVLPVGASRAQHVDVRFCFATNRNLRADVAAGRFRADLFYRVETPEVIVPRLRDRAEEIPWLIEHVLASLEHAPRAHPKLVEACMLRAWPGNVRELLSEIREAAGKAHAEGATTVTELHLRAHAGIAPGRSSSVPAPLAPARADDLTREAIERAIVEAGENLAGAARKLGLHRTQLYRRMSELRMPTPGLARRRRDG